MSRGRAFVWLAIYGAVVVFCTWPLAAHLSTHLPDTTRLSRYDLRLIVWALSWQTHALTSDPGRFFDANIFHPSHDALLYSEAGYGALPFFLPTMVASGNPVLSVNLMLLASLTATVWGLHVLVARATAMDAAGFVAAGTLLSSLWLLRLWGPIAPNYTVLQYFPAIIALTLSRRLSMARAVALGLVIALQAVVSPYIAAAVLATLCVLAAWRCLVVRSRSAWRLAGAVLAATVAAAALYHLNAALRSSEPNFAMHTMWREYRAGPIAVPQQWFANPHAPTSIAFSLQALIGIGLLLRLGKLGSPLGERLWRHGLLWTAVGLALTVTHGAIVGGYTIPTPHGVVLGLLLSMDLFRVPQRLGVGALIGLAVLAGIAFADVTWRLTSGWQPRTSRALRGALALSLVVVSAAPAMHPRIRGVSTRVQPLAPWGSFQIAEARSSPSAARVALADVREPVLVLDYTAPTTYGPGASDAQEMLESIGHWYPLLNGYGGYYPGAYPRRRMTGWRLPNALMLSELERSTGLAYVFVRGTADDPRMEPWWYLARRGRQGRLQLVAASDRELLFAVTR